VTIRFPARVAALAMTIGAAAHAAQAPRPPSVCPGDEPAAFHACAIAQAAKFNPPRTADGKPDFHGLWSRRVTAHEDLEAHPKTLDDSGGASVVVDPADGKVPMQPWADAWRTDLPQKFIHPHAACFLSGVPATMYAANLHEFLQTPAYFVIQSEDAHPFRLIPLDGRPHVGQDIRLWQGDSRGRWEGNTLVVDTTNQNGKPWLDQRARFYTEEAHVVERFTMIDANTIHYQASIDDPNVYTRPWTIAAPLRRNADTTFELWEQGCNEGNGPALTHMRNAGLRVSSGMTAKEARELRAAWETRERQR
jgi:hypothetical protein